MQSKEERLLKAIFATAEDEPDDNYPETMLDKVSYAEYVLAHSLEYTGKALNRLNRLSHLLSAAGKGEKLPDIIAHNELRMALEPLLHVENDVKDIAEMLVEVYRETKPQKEQ